MPGYRGGKKLKSHKGIASPLLPLMNAVFYGRQSGRRSTQRDDRAHSHGERVSVRWLERAPSDCPLSDVRTGGFLCVEEQVKGKTPVHFNSALVVFHGSQASITVKHILLEAKLEKKQKDIGSISVGRISS